MRLWGWKKKGPYTRDVLQGPRFSIGDYTYGEPRVLCFEDETRLHIGRYCSISDGVTILLGGNHRLDWTTTYPFPAFPEQWPEAAALQGHPASRGDVVIGSDVWIGFGATILSGVTIGDGAVIGAGAMVSRDVAPYAVAAGNPAREVRKRFSEDTISRLLALQWWDWPEDRVRKHLPLLCSGDIAALLAAAGEDDAP